MIGNSGSSTPERRKPVSEASRAFGNNVRHLMLTRNVTYDEIVSRTGIPKGNVWRYLNGKNEIPLNAASSIAEMFRYKTHELIGEKETGE